MKRIKLIRKLSLNKTKISELSSGQKTGIKGGAPKSDLVECLTKYHKCNTAECPLSYDDRCETGRGC